MKRIIGALIALICFASASYAQKWPFSGQTDIIGTPPAWTSDSIQGPYTIAPGITNFTVLTPNGNTPIESDLSSHRYHHHTAIGLTQNTVWVGFSSSGTNEDAGGQMVVAAWMSKNGSTFSAPIQIVPPQTAWSGTGPSSPNGARIAYPRCMVSYQGSLYIVAAIDDEISGLRNGSALVARQLNDDGTIGTLYRISSAPYVANSGFADIPYNADLATILYPSAKLYGIFGGSNVGATFSSDWIGFTSQGAEQFAEPTTFALNSARYLVRYWRETSGSNIGFFWQQTSNDNGQTWSTITITNVPNSPSAGFINNVSPTKGIFLLNPRDGATSRDPLAALIFNPFTGQSSGVYAIRQGISPTPTYPGTNKLGGAAYSSMASDGTNVWISYSMEKETIGATKLPLSGL